MNDRDHLAFILSLPPSADMYEERREKRVKLELLGPVSAKLIVGGDAGELKGYDLAVVDYSRHGFGLLVTRNESDQLEEFNAGDRIRNLVLYAPWAIRKVDVKVAHKTELQDGDHKACFTLGIKSRELITSGKTRKR